VATAPAPMMQQQPQIKPAAAKMETVSLAPHNIQPKVVLPQQKTLTIRPSGVQQPIQPASTVSTQTAIAASASKTVAKVKLKTNRPVAKAVTPELNKPQQMPQQQINSPPQQIIVNK